MMPQLRVRTEFSFRAAYGPVDEVVARLAELKTPVAGMVNGGGGCWGHARFERAVVSAGIEPAFGAEFFVTRGEAKPVAWVLGLSPSAVYRFATGPFKQESDFAAAGDDSGLIRFAGQALSDPATFDYVDVNPLSVLSQRRSADLARRTGKPLVLTGLNACPRAEDIDLMLAFVDRARDGLVWLAGEDEMRGAMRGLTEEEFAQAVRGAYEVGERLRGQRLPKAPIIKLDGDLRALCLAGKEHRLSRGHIAEWTEEYEQRLQHELALIAEKKFESYFLVVSDLVRWAKQRMLVGPARGSSAGSLVCYLTQITEVDPLVHRLLFERFIAPERNDLPDIDIDFSDVKRHLVFDYLAEKYGREHVARLGNINTLKPTSVLSQVGKRLGIPVHETYAVKNVLIEYSSGDSRYGKGLEDTLSNTAPGQRFSSDNPAFMALSAIEGHATHTGIHAAGVVVCNEPITNFCAVNEDGVAQIDKPDSEYLNLLKIDALGLRTLGILEDADVGTPDDFYAIKLNDQSVLDIINEKKIAGIFQFEGNAQRSVASQINFTEFKHLDHVTALARPGPLGGGGTGTYIRRHLGLEPVTFKHESMREYLSDALGVVLYQEQVLRIGREVGKLDWKELSEMRKAMSGRKGREFFDRLGIKFKAGAASSGMSDEEITDLWESIVTYGAWAMNACVVGSTRIKLARPNQFIGPDPTIAELFAAYKERPSPWIKQRRAMPQLLMVGDDGTARPTYAVDIYQTGIKPCLRLEFTDGKVVECTADHKFVINGQWRTAGDARVGDSFSTVARDRSGTDVSFGLGKGRGWRKGRKGGAGDGINFRNAIANDFRALKAYEGCEDCGERTERMEVHHNDHQHGLVSPRDLAWLCSGCHKRRHITAGDRRGPYARGWPRAEPAVLLSVTSIGDQMTYDIEMPDPHHNYVLANGIVTHNSHTCSYAIISYWCCWAKRYHPLAFAAATLRSAKSDEQVVDLLRELAEEGIPYVPLDPERSQMNWSVQDGKLVGGLMNAVGYGPAKAAAFIEARAAGTLTEKQRKDLAAAEVKFNDLFPIHTAYGEYYANPEKFGIRRGTQVKQLAELAEDEHAVVIVKMIAKERRDENETIRVKRRNGKLVKGNSLFLDMKVVDDSTSMPLTLRVDRWNWFGIGEKLADAAEEGKDIFLVRGRKIKGFPMIKVDKIKCLTKPEML